jgi:acyl-CoA synthetase (AMP-forming)/AMP-acid ligase II
MWGYILGHAEVTGLVVDDILFPLIAALKDTLTAIKLKVAILYTGADLPGGYEEFNAMIADQIEDEVEDVIIEDRDPFEILYTSGTTADPKGVLISHLTVFIMSLTNSIEIKVALGSVGTTLMPLFHCAQQTFSTTFFNVSGKTVILRGFDPAVMLDTIDREKIQVMFALPANPAIAAAAVVVVVVVGLPNKRWVEAVTAFVVATPGMGLNEADVIGAAKADLGGFEVPKKVVIVDQLPLTSTGKIKKNVLRDNYQSLYKE